MESCKYNSPEERILRTMQNLALALKLLTQNELFLNNRLLFWNKIQFDHDWLEQYIFKGVQYGADNSNN
jgi:hypothetical protein